MSETNESPLVAPWFTALKQITAVKELHLYEYIVKEDVPDSEFISVATECKISFQELYAECRRGTSWVASSGGSCGGGAYNNEYSGYYEALVESYLKSYQQGQQCAHVEDAEMPLSLAGSRSELGSERVICLPNSTAVGLTIISVRN